MAKIFFNPLNILLLLFLAPPDVTVHLGPLNFPIYRLYLVVMAPICTIKYMSIRKHPIDFFIFAYILWGVAALLYNHGTSEWQYAGILIVETVTPFLLARLYLSSREQFEAFVKLYFLLVMLILPFALYEMLTGHHVLRDIGRAVMGYGPMKGRPARFGLERAYGPFEHPIHYGFFCSVALGLALAMKGSATAKLSRWGAISLAVFCSMSSGPVLALMLQNILKAWDLGTKWMVARWRVLSAIFAALYVLIDLLSNRTPFHVLVSYGTFRLASAYNRIHIWNYGSASVAKYPVFGIGLNEWERAPWMSTSMDNFWLLTAVRYGLPAFIFLAAALAVQFYQLSQTSVTGQTAEYRKGWCISLVAMIIAGCTVHFWTALYCFFFMMIGATVWILEVNEASSDKATDTADEKNQKSPRSRPQIAYSRFPVRPAREGQKANSRAIR